MNFSLVLIDLFKGLLPLPLRSDSMVAWLRSMLAPLQTLNSTFSAWAYGVRYDISFNGQVLYLEHVLNDQFDDPLRRIYIDDPAGQQIFTPYLHNVVEQQPPLYLYNIADAIPTFGNIVLRNGSELNVTDDFVVHVPAGIFNSTVEVQMSKLIERYRIAGKRYSYQTF